MNDFHYPAPPANKSWFARHKVLTGILVLVLLIIVISSLGGKGKDGDVANSSNNTKQTESSKATPAIAITAQALFQAYETNAVKADSMYKDKMLEVTGTIKDIGNDILDAPYVTLKGDEYVTDVQCMLKRSEAEKAAELTKGSTVTLRGKGTGKLMNIMMRDCEVK